MKPISRIFVDQCTNVEISVDNNPGHKAWRLPRTMDTSSRISCSVIETDLGKVLENSCQRSFQEGLFFMTVIKPRSTRSSIKRLAFGLFISIVSVSMIHFLPKL